MLRFTPMLVPGRRRASTKGLADHDVAVAWARSVATRRLSGQVDRRSDDDDR
jgi:hypothetical protein